MKKEHPLVSIIMAAYNAEKYIVRALDSILGQTYENIEIIVVNDGSTDDTNKILQKYIQKGVKSYYIENKGQAAALNYGYGRSSGSFIKFMDADDLLNDLCLEIQVDLLRNDLDYIAYCEWARFFNNDILTAKFISKPYWKNMSPVDFLTADFAGPLLQCGTMLISRQIIEQSGLWDIRLIHSNDTEFFTRSILKSKGIKFSEGARLYYRSGVSTSLTNIRNRKYFESVLLGSKLIQSYLLPIENSVRTRSVVANILQQSLYEMYPNFINLEKVYNDEIKKLGGSTLVCKSGKFFNLMEFLFGWRFAILIKKLIYKIGYSPSNLSFKYQFVRGKFKF